MPADEAGGPRGILGSESYSLSATVRDVYSVNNTLYVQSPVIVDLLNQSSRKREAHKTCSLINFDSLVGKQVVLYIHKPEFWGDDNLGEDVLHRLECVGVGLEDPGAGSVLILAEPLHARPPELWS